MDRYVITVPPLNLTGIIASIPSLIVLILRCQPAISEMTNLEEDTGVSYISDISS